MNKLFEEHQYQRRLIPWTLVAFIWAVSIEYIYNKGLAGENLIFSISVLLFFPISTTLLLFLFKLSVLIDDKYLMFKMFPFHAKYKIIRLDEIKTLTVKEYNKNRSFHGWGLGMSWNGKHKSYTVNGYQGVEIVLKDEKKIFLGTQKPELLVESLNIK